MKLLFHSGAALALAAACAQAESSPNNPARPAAQVKMISANVPVAKTGPGAGVVAVLENGQYRAATPGEMAALRGNTGAISARIAPPAGAIQSRDGRATGILVPESLMSGTVAVMGADGKLRTRCVTGKKAMENALKQGSKKQSAAEVIHEK